MTTAQKYEVIWPASRKKEHVAKVNVPGWSDDLIPGLVAGGVTLPDAWKKTSKDDYEAARENIAVKTSFDTAETTFFDEYFLAQHGVPIPRSTPKQGDEKEVRKKRKQHKAAFGQKDISLRATLYERIASLKLGIKAADTSFERQELTAALKEVRTGLTSWQLLKRSQKMAVFTLGWCQHIRTLEQRRLHDAAKSQRRRDEAKLRAGLQPNDKAKPKAKKAKPAVPKATKPKSTGPRATKAKRLDPKTQAAAKAAPDKAKPLPVPQEQSAS